LLGFSAPYPQQVGDSDTVSPRNPKEPLLLSTNGLVPSEPQPPQHPIEDQEHQDPAAGHGKPEPYFRPGELAHEDFHRESQRAAEGEQTGDLAEAGRKKGQRRNPAGEELPHANPQAVEIASLGRPESQHAKSRTHEHTERKASNYTQDTGCHPARSERVAYRWR
jgi:hypothetical protein